MGAAIIEPELLELPAEFRGLPYSRKLLAFESGCAMLPATATVHHLGPAAFELATVNAAAHWLSVNSSTSTEFLDDGPSRRPESVDTGTIWAGSSYGAIVKGILARLPRESGRRRSFPTVAV